MFKYFGKCNPLKSPTKNAQKRRVVGAAVGAGRALICGLLKPVFCAVVPSAQAAHTCLRVDWHSNPYLQGQTVHTTEVID